MTKLMLAIVAGASALAFAPQPVAASECTDNYMKCLNDTYEYEGASQMLADIECFAAYTGCVRKSIIAY